MAKLKTKLLLQRPVQKLLAPLGREVKPDKWVFVIGCYNSGTTLLMHLLGKHPQIAALPTEGVALSDVWTRPEEYGWNRMWCRCLDQVRLTAGPDMEALARRVKKQWSFALADRPLVLEKSIANAARMPFIEAYFRPAFFIYIVRNGYAVAEGLRRGARPKKWGRHEFGDRYPIELCAEQWACSDNRVSADRGGIGRILDITYEQLTRAPRTVANRITDFLGIAPFDDGTLEGVWRIHGIRSRIRNMNAEAITRLTPADIRAVEHAAGDTLRKYGYLA